MPYKKIYESFNVAEFQLVKHALKNGEVNFVVWNESVLQSGLGLGGAHGARVLVHQDDMKKAKGILEEFDFINVHE